MLRMILLGIGLFFFSCSEGPSTSAPDLGPTQQVELLGTNSTFKIPVHFQRTSRYRIGEAMPHLLQDTIALYQIQDKLETMEFEDRELDIFVDTISKDHILIIMDDEPITFTQTEAGILSSMVRAGYNEIRTSLEGVASVENLSTQFRNDATRSALKIKYKFTNEVTGFDHYQTSYFFSTPLRSLMIQEFSTTEKDLENYLWTIRQ